MLFNSIEFLIFFPMVIFLFFILPHHYRWILLLVASCVFYMFFIPQYILILAALIVIDYIAGRLIEQTVGKARAMFLIFSICSTCSILFLFKYFNFFNSNLAYLAYQLHWNYPIKALELILPIGLSFHTFQSLSYVIEVFRGKQKAEKNLGIYALYVMFFPQLVAGPIERPQNLLHQFYGKHEFDGARVTDGLKLMLWGMFKKVVIADRLAVFVNQAYSNPSHYTGVSLIIAALFFSYQIYCDFSGYSDIAVGSAKVMGFRLTNNFNYPFYSKTMAELWRKWHISLISWFRDYVYFPLFKKIKGFFWGAGFSLLTTFMLSGFWHGADWTFIVWGGINGFYILFGNYTRNWRNRLYDRVGLTKLQKLHNGIKIITVFSLATVSGIFFRANSLKDAFYILSHLNLGIGGQIANVIQKFGSSEMVRSCKPFFLEQPALEFVISVLLIIALEWIQSRQRRTKERSVLSGKPFWFRWSVYYVLVGAILLLGVFEYRQFIYFQF